MLDALLLVVSLAASPAAPNYTPMAHPIEVKARKGSRRIGGRGSSGKGGRYVGGRRK